VFFSHFTKNKKYLDKSIFFVLSFVTTQNLKDNTLCGTSVSSTSEVHADAMLVLLMEIN
jgi:hypothetical protein